MITMGLSSVFLFASALMMLGGLGLMVDAGLQFLRSPRPGARSGRG